jgi:hypothetical protein
MISVFLLSGVAAAQSMPKFLDHALVKHNNSEVTIVANDALPLLQAISELRLEYGWRINWESAPGYSHFDLVDDTDPKWRASHPVEKGRDATRRRSFHRYFSGAARSIRFECRA